MCVIGEVDRVADGFALSLGESAEAADVEEEPAYGIVVRLLADADDLGAKHTSITREGAAGLDDDVEVVDLEVLAEVLHDRGPVLFLGLRRLEVLCGESSADVNALQRDVLLMEEGVEQVLHLGESSVPLADVALLGADMERDAVRHESQFFGLHSEAERHAGMAAELAGEGPVGTLSVEDDPEVDLGARGALGQVDEVLLGVRGVQRDPMRERERDVRALFDGVAIADLLTGDAEREQLLDLGPRGDVEIRAALRDRGDHLVHRARLDGVENARARHRAHQTIVGRIDAVKVDDEQRRLLRLRELLDVLEVELRKQLGRAVLVLHWSSL